jgi:hypothetical protein
MITLQKRCCTEQYRNFVKYVAIATGEQVAQLDRVYFHQEGNLLQVMGYEFTDSKGVHHITSGCPAEADKCFHFIHN